MYHLNFSPNNSGLVVFVLYSYGGGAPVGCGSARQLFLAPHSHELHVYSAPWSFLSSSRLCCWACCGVSLCGSFCPQKFELKYVGLS